MKKLIIFSTICLILLAKSSFAQSVLGIRGGVNFSQLNTNAGSVGNSIQQSLDTKSGWSFGLYGHLGRTIFFQPELLLSSRGGTVGVLQAGSLVKTDFTFTNFDLPLLIGFRPIKILHFMAGPVASFRISDTQNIGSAIGSFNYSSNATTWGYQVGGGIHILGLDIDLRHEGGLSDVSAFKVSNTQSTQRLSGWQLSVGFKII